MESLIIVLNLKLMRVVLEFYCLAKQSSSEVVSDIDFISTRTLLLFVIVQGAVTVANLYLEQS